MDKEGWSREKRRKSCEEVRYYVDEGGGRPGLLMASVPLHTTCAALVLLYVC